MSRNPSNSIRNFVLLLKKQAAGYNFGAELGNHLRDRLIADINNAALQKRYSWKSDQLFHLCGRYARNLKS